MDGTPDWNAECWLRRGLQATVVIGLVLGALSAFDSRAQRRVLALVAFGSPKFENVPISTIGKNQIAAQRIIGRVGYR